MRKICKNQAFHHSSFLVWNKQLMRGIKMILWVQHWKVRRDIHFILGIFLSSPN